MTDPVCVVSEFFARDMTESYAIKSCEVWGDFRGDDDVVGSESVVGGGERDFDELSSEVGERFFGLFDDVTRSGFDTFAEVFFRETDFDAFQVCAIPDISGETSIRPSSVVASRGSWPCMSIPDEVSISDSPCHDTHRVEGLDAIGMTP
jgi:hypothetical protein